jgi:hypothetical protein
VHLAPFGDNRNAYGVLVGKAEGKRLLKKPIRKWDDDIKMNLRETGFRYGLDSSGSE